MFSLSYLPLLVLLIDVIAYIVCSVKLHKVMPPSLTMVLILATLVVIYSWAGGIFNISKAFSLISFSVTIVLGASIADQYNRYV